jgi:hypothetical protein
MKRQDCFVISRSEVRLLSTAPQFQGLARFLRFRKSALLEGVSELGAGSRRPFSFAHPLGAFLFAGLAALALPAQAICMEGGPCCKPPQVLNPETRRCEALDACRTGTTRVCTGAICTCQERITCAIRLQWDPREPAAARVTDEPRQECDRAGMELALAAALARLLGAP